MSNSDPTSDETALGGSGGRRVGLRRWMWLSLVLIPFVAAATVVGARSVLSGDSDSNVVRLHALAPPFEVAGLEDPSSRVSLSRFEGAPVVVNFWASWCAPCRREMKAFETAHRMLAGRVTIIGIDINDSRAAAIAFARREGTQYLLGFDDEGTTAERYGVVGLPATVFINANGIMLERRLGAMTRAELSGTIKQLLGP